MFKIMESQEEILEEIAKCRSDPYYFANKYLIVKNHLGKSVPFRTVYTKEEFNEMFSKYQNNREILTN